MNSQLLIKSYKFLIAKLVAFLFFAHAYTNRKLNILDVKYFRLNSEEFLNKLNSAQLNYATSSSLTLKVFFFIQGNVTKTYFLSPFKSFLLVIQFLSHENFSLTNFKRQRIHRIVLSIRKVPADD